MFIIVIWNVYLVIYTDLESYQCLITCCFSETLNQSQEDWSARCCLEPIMPCSVCVVIRPTSSSLWAERLYCLLYGLVVWMRLSAFPRGLASRRGGCVYSYAGHGRWCVPCFRGSAFVPIWESAMGHLRGWQCLGWWDWVIRNPMCFNRL